MVRRISYLCALIFLAVVLSSFAQEKPDSFFIIKEIKHLPVLSQGSTGTCWSFTATSFLESEIIRKGFEETDLSEMYFVYKAYLNKAKNYLMYHGESSFSQGGQAHDVFDVVNGSGMVKYSCFPGEKTDGKYQHNILLEELRTELDKLNKTKEGFSVENLKSVEAILKKHIGKLPGKVKTSEEKLTAREFADKFGIKPDDYIELTSYDHHPFYKPFVLEVPDNWSHALYYNLPIDELMEVLYYSLTSGYSVCWDGDTSEKTFSHKTGKADLPENLRGKADQALRKETFFNRSTTDDHLMHIVGLSKDSEGRNCFYTKNSWGAESNNYGGYLHMTEDYVRLKTVAVMVHKDAIPENIKQKLNL